MPKTTIATNGDAYAMVYDTNLTNISNSNIIQFLFKISILRLLSLIIWKGQQAN